MAKPRILSVAGTRPQLIKQAALFRAFSEKTDFHMSYTFQHYDPALSQGIASGLNLPLPAFQPLPAHLEGDYRLAAMIDRISAEIRAIQPSLVLVMGDTDSTLAGAIAASRNSIPIAHIEAGERSGNLSMPEEWNRILTDQLSSLLFCASEKAAERMKNEYPRKKTVFTGDIMKDIFLQTRPVLPTLEGPYHYVTLHRLYTRENFSLLKRILENLDQLPEPVIFSLHPSMRAAFQQHGIVISDFPNIRFIEPVGYAENLGYMKNACTVFTDSGGMQKECYWLKTPCTTLRPETEWPETLAGNFNRLVYENPGEIRIPQQPDQRLYNPDLYGSGNAADIILNELPGIL